MILRSTWAAARALTEGSLVGDARAASASGLLSNRTATLAAAIATGAGAVGLVGETARAGPSTADGRLLLLSTALAAALALALVALPWNRWRPGAMVVVLPPALVIGTVPMIALPRPGGWLALLPCWLWAGLILPRRVRLAATPALLAAITVSVLTAGQRLPALEVLAAVLIVAGSGEGLAFVAARAVQARERAVRAEARAAVLLTHAPGVVVVLDCDNTVREVSDGTARLLGTLEPDTALFDVVHPDDLLLARTMLAQAVGQPGERADAELRLRRSDGAWLRLASTVTAIEAEGRSGDRGVRILSAVDVTAERDARDQAVQQASTDALTGLASRRAIRAAIDDAHGRLRSQPGGHDRGVLAFVDLDGFKLVNDSFGHGVGDRLLMRVADRLRVLAGTGCTIGRLSGDEFAVLNPARAASDQAAFGQQVLAALLGIEQLDGHDLHVSASVGVAGLRVEGDTDELLRRADLAMYRAKAVGGGRAHVADDGPRLTAVPEPLPGSATA